MEFNTDFVSEAMGSAIADARRREVFDIATFNAQDYQNKITSFSVSGDLTERGIDSVLRAVNDAIAGGVDFGSFTKMMTPDVLNGMTSPFTVFNNAVNNVYQKARSDQQGQLKYIRPYLEYVTFGDDRVRPAHAAMNGVVAAQDDPFWEKNYPPNGHNCRCTARSKTAGQVRRDGDLVETDAQVRERILMPQIKAGVPADELIHPEADKGWEGRFRPNQVPFRKAADEYATYRPDEFSSILPLDVQTESRRRALAFSEAPFPATETMGRASREESAVNSLRGGPWKPEDIYPTVLGKMVFGAMDITPAMDIAAAVIKNPVLVYRDFQQRASGKSSLQSAVIEQYYGLVRGAAGVARPILVWVNRGIIIRVDRFLDLSNKIFAKLAGLQVYEKQL
jgi:SPP1 gp7 family putative phage head morphogenesis protein